MVQKHGGWIFLEQTGSIHSPTHVWDLSSRPDGLKKISNTDLRQKKSSPFWRWNKEGGGGKGTIYASHTITPQGKHTRGRPRNTRRRYLEMENKRMEEVERLHRIEVPRRGHAGLCNSVYFWQLYYAFS